MSMSWKPRNVYLSKAKAPCGVLPGGGAIQTYIPAKHDFTFTVVSKHARLFQIETSCIDVSLLPKSKMDRAVFSGDVVNLLFK